MDNNNNNFYYYRMATKFNMKEKIENLIKLSRMELNIIRDKISNSKEINEELDNELLYWAIRIQTLMEVLELIENSTFTITSEEIH